MGTGGGSVAAMGLGADGGQVGTRFALPRESSACDGFKSLCLSLNEGDTVLSLKKVAPTRIIRKDFFRAVEEAENRGATAEELQALLGRGRSRKGIFEGDLSQGDLEIGQISSLLKTIPTAADIINNIVDEYNHKLQAMTGPSL